MAEIQMFGHPKSQTTRKAQRFFSERRVPFHYLDLRKHAPTPGELRKWADRFGVDELLDPSSRSYQEQGLQFVSASTDTWLERIAADPTVLDLPLVRCGRDLSVGDDPEAWQRFADAVREA